MAIRTTTQQQRWLISFERDEPALAMRDADIVRGFETALTEAALPLSRTTSSRPRPRLRLAASLPAGVVGERELLEVYLDEPVDPDRVRAAAELVPSGLTVTDVRRQRSSAPSAASRVRHADYEVRVESDSPIVDTELRDAVRRLVRAPALPGRRRRGPTERRTDAGARDLRPLVEAVDVVEVDGTSALLSVRLRIGRSGAGRPDDVVSALGLPLRVVSVRRRPLEFVDR
ncbi:MAG: TIGR03936 family radical SAM-associated protein [Chloroflexota bacterium]|nr:TIGR03936 family radical SAM-associated protein [Chloroflexota bacterium]